MYLLSAGINVPMKPPFQCHTRMSSIQNLLNPEACLSSSSELVGFIFVHLSSTNLLCPGQPHKSGRGQHRLSLYRTQVQIQSSIVALHSQEQFHTVIMSHIPIAQTPSPVSQTQTGGPSTHFLLFYVVQYWEASRSV